MPQTGQIDGVVEKADIASRKHLPFHIRATIPKQKFGS